MIKFFKYNSNGNDFIILESLDKSFDYLSKNPKIVQRLCTREFSIGADGLILLQKSLVADFKMKIFNSDGKEAFMCGNGLLSLVKFIYDFIDKNYSFLIETKVGIYKTFVDENKISFISKPPKILKESMKISLGDTRYDLKMLNSGVFHGVIFLKNIDRVDVFKIGKKIRNLKEFEPSGINVNFCEVIDERTIKVRTFEKGVENETLCCSTGALAVSYTHFLKNKNIEELILRYKGGEIKTNIEKDEIKLTSEPVFAYRGYLDSISG
ncbi:MAG: Diaminopimelate epimerase [Candidatus Anoxychlamydiales bacterium]|nr:Diaminopimelate epimerase [Candidatus Anoxychlamydiales bacterium]NGX40865.1 Diaminopimelate epimerase [Candidatus Anoxychlamydiales bacterium]HEU64581.1 diaminopimelate epimerase [Chlamydiota bacterium]